MTSAGFIRLGAGNPPAPGPALGEGALYFDSGDDQLYVIDAAGTTVGPIGAGGGGALIGPSNALFVDVGGNDGTGTRGDASKPFATIQAAVAAAFDGDQVRIGPGLWDVSFVQIAPAVPRLSIVGSGITATVLARTGGGAALFDLPNSMQRFSLTDLAIDDSTLQPSITANGTGGGGTYLAEGLVLRNLRVSNNGGLMLNASYVSRLFVENFDGGGVFGSNLSINTCRIERFFNARWGNVFRLIRDLTSPDAPSSLSALHVDVISACRTVSAASVYLGGHPNVLFDAECYLGGGLSVDPFGPPLNAPPGVAAPNIRFFGEAVFSISFQTVFSGGLPDTPTAMILDFSGAKTAQLAIDTAAWGGVNRQKVRANGLICPLISASLGIDVFDRFADGATLTGVAASGPSGFGGNDGTYTPGRWTGDKKLTGAPANANFGFYAFTSPTCVQVAPETAAMGFAIPTAIANSYVTCDVSVLPSGTVFVAAFWKVVY